MMAESQGYGLTGKFVTDSADRETLIAILLEAAQLMEMMDTCRAYIVCRDAEDAGGTWVLELWDSEDAHEQSLAVAGVGELIARARPLIKGIEGRVSLVPVGGKGW